MSFAVFGAGCFWCVEAIFSQINGVSEVISGYCNGHTKNPTYKQVCTGTTGHAEVCKVVYDSTKVSYDELLKIFWESHDPTQGMRQGNDVGTQYRSGIYWNDENQLSKASDSKKRYQNELTGAGLGEITTELVQLDSFYYAEDYHQQYLGKNPNGYCGLGGVGLECPL